MNRLRSRPFHTTLQEFENRVFALKTHRTFAVHITLEEFKNATITGHFGFVFEENSVRAGNHVIIVTPSCLFLKFQVKISVNAFCGS